MVRDELADFVETVTLGGPDSKNKAYVYELFIEPERYMDGMRLPEARVPKSTFYNNPFNLKEVKDARYNT